MYAEGAKSECIWALDHLICPQCAGEMRGISFIYHVHLIMRILECLKANAPKGRISGLSQLSKKIQRELPEQKTVVEYIGWVPFNDGWPDYEEPVFEM